MNFVDPIRNIEHIRHMKRYLKKHSHRDYLLFTLGINTGLRISVLLRLTVSDILTENLTPKTYLLAEDQKSPIYINSSVKDALLHFLDHTEISFDSYLFFSNNPSKPLTRQQAYRIIKKAACEAGVEANIGTHTLRKTFGYHAYRQGVAISLLQERFHHATPSETLRYIGVLKEEKHVPLIDVRL